MHLLPVPYFEDLQLASGRTVSELETELRVLLAVKLFELKRVSIGQAANRLSMKLVEATIREANE